MKSWTQPDKHTWLSAGKRIRLCTNPDQYFVYVKGMYLGSDTTLKGAMSRAETGKRSPTHLNDELSEGVPAFLALSKEEREAERKSVPMPKPEFGRRLEAMTDYKDMSLEALARAYNESVEVAHSKGLMTYKPINRFADQPTAIKFLDQIDSSIKAATDAARAEKRQPAPKPPTKVEQRAEGEKAVKEFKKQKRRVTKAEPAAPTKGAKAEPKGKAKGEPAPKAPAPGKTKPAATPASPGKVPASVETFNTAIGARPGTNKEKLATLLMKNVGHDISIEDVTKVVYGKASNPAISAVINGLSVTIKEKSLPYEIRRKENKLGLYATGK